VRAYVMARKGVLITDPSVRDMSPSRWMFEYIALAKKEREEREFNIRALRNVLVSTLGLNLLRPEDSNGNPKRPEDMTEEDRESFLPLSVWMGNEGLLKAVKEQQEVLDITADLPPTDSTYEAMVAAIDAADGDIEPIIGIDQLNLPDNPKKKFDEKVAGILSKADVGVDGDI